MKIKYLLPIVALIFSINSFGQSKNTKLNYDQSLYSSVEYRLIGPFRGGRAGTAVGVLNNPNLYYMGYSWWRSLEDSRFRFYMGANK